MDVKIAVALLYAADLSLERSQRSQKRVRGVKCRHYETPPRIAHQWNPLSVSVCGPDRDPGAMGVQRYTNDGMSLGTLIAPGTGGLADARAA